MKKTVKRLALLLGLVALGLSRPTWQLYRKIRNTRSEDPLVWEGAIGALESKTRGRYAAGQGVVFIGSSSIRL